ncbi:transposase [Salinibacter ruber]|uniref:transposase n=1 Tax=Salinibacter ruber TaxID=146919 RepID=UPI00234302C2
MTDHLSAGPEERTGDRQGYRNGSYERQLTTRVGTLELEVPPGRKGRVSDGAFPAAGALREGPGSGPDAVWHIRASPRAA